MGIRTHLRAGALAATLATSIALGGLAACGTAPSPAAGGATYETISSSEAAALMESEQGYVIVDVRTPEEFAEGHIPGAICIPVETIGDEPPAELADTEQLILVYCRSGRRSAIAAAQLARLGYANVVDFGGIIDWDGEVVTD